MTLSSIFPQARQSILQYLGRVGPITVLSRKRFIPQSNQSTLPPASSMDTLLSASNLQIPFWLNYEVFPLKRTLKISFMSRTQLQRMNQFKIGSSACFELIFPVLGLKRLILSGIFINLLETPKNVCKYFIRNLWRCKVSGTTSKNINTRSGLLNGYI